MPLFREQIVIAINPRHRLAKQDAIDVSSAATKLLEEKQPSKKFVEVDQIGGLTVFLCSDAAANITGIALPIDGAWTAR